MINSIFNIYLRLNVIVHTFHLTNLQKKYSMLNTTENNKVNEQALASNKREKTCNKMWYLFSKRYKLDIFSMVHVSHSRPRSFKSWIYSRYQTLTTRYNTMLHVWWLQSWTKNIVSLQLLENSTFQNTQENLFLK